MKDNLEQLVRNNSASFNDKEPGDKVWKRISNQLHSGSNYSWLWKVAAILFFCTSVLLVFQVDYSQPHRIAKVETQQNEFAAVESFYFNLISEKKSLIYDFEEADIVINQDFEQDLQKLDAMYQVLKEEMDSNPSKKVVDALILNLLVRIDILNEQLQNLDTEDADEMDEGQVNA